MKEICGLILWCCGVQMHTVSQPRHITDGWFMAGLSYKYSRVTTMQGQLIYLGRQQATAMYAQVFFKTGRHVTFNAGYLYLGARVSGATEHTLLNGVVFAAAFGKLAVDNRNLIWNRLRRNLHDLHFYRNRFRLKWPVATGKSRLSAYVFDEVFYLLNDGKWNRNRLALGMDYDMQGFLNVDVAFVRQTGNNGSTANLFFVLCTLKLVRKT